MENQEIIDKQLFKKSKVIKGFRYVRWNICLEYAEETKEQERKKLIEELEEFQKEFNDNNEPTNELNRSLRHKLNELKGSKD